MTLRTITEDQAREIMAAGDIPESMISASRLVAVILTQGWCPQWGAMESYVARMAAGGPGGHPDLTVFQLVYDALPFYHEFLYFKETRFNNLHIPYVRYYRDGGFLGDSNYIGESGFHGILNG